MAYGSVAFGARPYGSAAGGLIAVLGSALATFEALSPATQTAAANYESLLQGLTSSASLNFESNLAILTARLSNAEAMATLAQTSPHIVESFIAVASEIAKGVEALEGLAGVSHSAETPFEMPVERIQVMVLSSISILLAATIASIDAAQAATITSTDIETAI